MGGQPVWDDATLIAGHLLALDGAGLVALWEGPISPSGPGSTYYRPLALCVMALVGQLGWWALHLLGLVCHAVSAALMVSLCQRARVPIAAGLCFALHPLASEVLGWSSALPDALAVVLALAAARARHAAAVIALLVAGALCKETALVIPVFLGLAGILSVGWWRTWGVSALVVVGLRFAVDVQAPAEVWHKLSLVPAALGWSVGSVAWPFPLSAVRDVRLAPGGMLWLSVVLLASMALLAGRRREAWAGLGLMVCAPALALPTMLDGYLVAERYMYPGLVGFGVWAAYSLPPVRKPLWRGGAVALGCAAAMAIFSRSGDWRDDHALFGAAVQAQPSSSLAWHLMGMVHLRSAEPAQAADAFARAIENGHPYPTEYTLRLRALVEAGRAIEALEWADAGPKDGLTAEHIAWWARAAYEAGQPSRARDLVMILRTPRGFDGPPWLHALAEKISATSPDPVQEPSLSP